MTIEFLPEDRQKVFSSMEKSQVIVRYKREAIGGLVRYRTESGPWGPTTLLLAQTRYARARTPAWLAARHERLWPTLAKAQAELLDAAAP